jgi:RHS repeat-associated protein
MTSLRNLILTSLFSVLTLALQAQSYLIVKSGPDQVCGNASGTVTMMSNATVMYWEEGTFNGQFTLERTINTTNSYVNYSITAPGTKAYRAYCSGANGMAYTNVVSIRASEAVNVNSITTTAAKEYQGISGSGSFIANGLVGTPRWRQRPIGLDWSDSPTGSNFSNLTTTTDFKVYVANSDYSCEDESNIITIIIYKTGTLKGPAIASEGRRVTFNLEGNYGAIERWELSEDGGSTWKEIPNKQLTYSHLIKSSLKVRVRVNQGTVSPALYTNVVNVTMTPFAPQGFPVSTANFVKEHTTQQAGYTSADAVGGLSVKEKKVVTTFIDGFARPIQQNIGLGSPKEKDIIQPLSNDLRGNQTIQYNPYVAGGADGNFAPSAVKDQLAYYNNGIADKVQDDPAPFSKTVFEKSPLAWVTEHGAPGTAFQPGTGHTVKIIYGTNGTGEVRLFQSNGTSAAFYDPNELMMQERVDQDGKRSQTFTDKIGRKILTRIQLDEAVGSTIVPWLETYYIYNTRGEVSYMISPKGVTALKAGGWIFSQPLKDQYVHEFVYDERGRVVEKKVPGQAWTFFCYDLLNRLVLVQDGKTRTDKKWLFIKYDRLGRPVKQGLYLNTTATSRLSMQQAISSFYNGNDNYFEDNADTNISFPSADTQDLVKNFYDSYVGTYAPQNLQEEAEVSSEVTGLLTATSKAILGTNTWLASRYFYDEEGRVIQIQSNNHLNFSFNDITTMVYDFTGRIKIKKTQHDAGAGRLTTVVNKFAYDHMGRITRIYQNNNNASSDQLVVRYDYNELGQLIDKKLHCVICPSADPLIAQPGTLNNANIYSNSYNGTDKAYIAKNQITLAPGFTIPAGKNFIARIGVTSEEALSQEQFLQSIDYRYSIQGRLQSINNAQLEANIANNDDSNDYFGIEFLYEKTEAGFVSSSEVNYNGNISAIKWKGFGTAPGVNNQHSYKYKYDKQNRLASAVSQVYGTAWNKEAGAINEAVKYDLNGNIATLTRNARMHQLGLENNAPVSSYGTKTVDELTYAYNGSMGDQLIKVTDAAPHPGGFDNGTTATNDDFTYDVNGNLLRDKNKGINSDIEYNHLGKPFLITYADGRKIEYLYDAHGTKLKMKTYEAGGVLKTTTDYINGFVYENDVLSFFSSPEGRVAKKGTALEYQYAISDHQGNTRVVFTSAPQTPQTFTTDFETLSNSDFQNYPQGAHRSQVEWYNHSSPSPPKTSSQLLTSAANSQVGVAKNFRVYPGDKISIEAYAKFFTQSGSGNLVGFASALTSAFGLTAAATGEAARAYAALNDYGSFVAGGGGRGSNTFPKAFVNILLFDKDFNFIDIAYEQIDGGEQPAGSTAKTPHDFLSREYTVKDAGYAYVYISNENPTYAPVYFDDVTVTLTPTGVLQYNEYYPFGLQTDNSWTRENNSNNFLYNQGNELNTTTGWYETAYRDYDPVLGRFMQVDPLASKYSSFSAYHYAFNNPILFNDPNGAEGILPGPSWELQEQRYDAWYQKITDQHRAQDAARRGEMDAVRDYARRNGDLASATGYYWSAIEDRNGNYRNFEISGLEYENARSQQEDQEYLKNFLLGNFGNEIRALNHLARETGQKLAWWIDVEGKYASDPGIPGDTRRIKERQTTYISIHAYPLASAMTGDSRLLYVVVAHELVHAADILNGNRDFWNGWYGEDMGHKIMEHHAYTRSAALETQLGVNYGGNKMLFDLFVPDNYLEIRR